MKLRPEVQEFAEAMEHVLRDNDHKGGWQDMDGIDLLGAIERELRELSEAYGDANYVAARKEAIDVANFCMMFWDVFSEHAQAQASWAKQGGS